MTKNCRRVEDNYANVDRFVRIKPNTNNSYELRSKNNKNNNSNIVVNSESPNSQDSNDNNFNDFRSKDDNISSDETFFSQPKM